MSHQRPIFNGNLIGKANRVVMNGLLDQADYVGRNHGPVDWARMQMRPGAHDMAPFLAMITGWVVVPAHTIRWRYTFKRAVRENLADVVKINNAEDDLDLEPIAINLYEYRNVSLPAEADQDGPLAVPNRTVGPVGAKHTGATWVPDTTEQPVIMFKVYTKEGDIGYVFSHPNPVACVPEEEPV